MSFKMPELPEVEVTMRGIRPALDRAVITDVWTDGKRLREPIPAEVDRLIDARVEGLSRRAKYILMRTSGGTLVIHLGMSGHLSVLSSPGPRLKHDHFEMTLDSGTVIRLNDARRFGLLGYVPPGEDPLESKWLCDLGPEPLGGDFTPDGLHEALSKRRCTVKQAIMDQQVVVGVGNIYASEVLFMSGVRPDRRACDVTEEECALLCSNIRKTLNAAIAKGGTTIRTFQGADGKMGYFVQDLSVYGHKGELCRRCGTPIEEMTIGQRSTYFCPRCQK
ncbi:MAG: bifunctional DNA-formamidopyrimidine glycosylase/DNA-(apurinic or apyrimidinic site) lyase [Succinivibrio sp.]